MASRSLLLALATAVAAQQTTVSLPFFGFDDQTIVGSVIAVQNSLTTMSLACPTDEDQNDCGLAAAQTLTVGSSSYHMYMSDADFVMTQDCTPNTAMTDIVCVESASGASANDPGVSTVTYDATDVAVIPVTVTSGASLLAAGAAVTGPASTMASATGTSSHTTSGGVVVVTGSGSSTGLSTSARTTGSTRASGAAESSSVPSSSTTSNAAAATALPALLAAGAGLVGLLL